MNAYKDRIAETERAKELERGAGAVLMEPWNRADEQVSSGGDIREPEAAGEEQPDKLRKTTRFEQEATSSSAAAFSDPTVALEYRSSGDT